MKTNIAKNFVFVSGIVFALSSETNAGFTSAGALFNVVTSAGSGAPTNAVTQISPYAWGNTGGWTGSQASVSWANDIQGWNPTTGAGFSNANIVIRNNTASAQDFLVTVSVLGTATGPFVAAGSLGGQYVNGSGSLGSLTSTGPLWTAGIDGTTVNSQLNSALFFAQPYQVVSLGNFNFSNLQIASSVSNDFSIQYSLRLSAGGEASFTSAFSFQSVPGPASIALIGLMPFVRSRRRK